MLDRRNVIGGAMAGLTGLLAADAPVAAAQRDSSQRESDMQIAEAIDRLRRTIEDQFDPCELGRCVHLSRLQQVQRTFLQSRHKYPDFIEVGPDVWDRVLDWHVKQHVATDARRLADGRYVMTYRFTTLLLRPEQTPDYVGSPFDIDRG
jgi:hypothetical protein